MRALPTALIILAASGAVVATFQVPKATIPNAAGLGGQTTLPNGWKVTPAGRQLALKGDLPTRISFTADGKQAVVVSSGWHDTGVTLIDLKTESVVTTKALSGTAAGLVVDGADLYVSGGKNSVFMLPSDLSGRATSIEANKRVGKRFLGGLTKMGETLFSVDTGRDIVARIEGQPLATTIEMPVGKRPYGCAISPDQKTLAVSIWGGTSVWLLDPTTLKVRAKVPVGVHPNELVYGKDGRLFVVNAGSNTVSVLAAGEVVETIRTSPHPSDRLGSTPDALALSPDGTTLYVANADNNCVAIVDVHKPGGSSVKGFIPTGWYPSALAVTPDGKRLMVGVGKGLAFAPNAKPNSTGTTNANAKSEYDYICAVLNGWISFVDIGGPDKLAQYTAQVKKNFPTPTDEGVSPAEIRNTTRNALSKIKHVVYIIRENRTYDQVFGDIKEGNGDPNLVFFGEDVTPNAHALAREFVLMDNLYCNGEVSQDGHQWCNGAYATMFTTRAYLSSYSGRSQPDGDDSVTASPAGYLWDSCLAHGRSYYTYGEFSSFKSTPDTAPVFTGPKTLNGFACPNWTGRDKDRADIFIADLKKAEVTGKWPAYMVMSLGEDHTGGLRAGQTSPKACVASNDLGLGKMVDAVSHSKFWKDTAFFVIEDDAQNGPDHVDAHRTVGLVISPYTRRKFVDSTLYTTAGMVRTMELILGLPPMTQFDERATPLVRTFTPKADLTPFDCRPAKVDVNETNPTTGLLARQSAKLDWTGYDRADPDKLNEILWAALKPGKPMPAPVRSAALIR